MGIFNTGLDAVRGLNNYLGIKNQSEPKLPYIKPTTQAEPNNILPNNGSLTQDQAQRMKDVADRTGVPTDTIAAQMQIARAALSPQELAALGIDENKIRTAQSEMNQAAAPFQDNGDGTLTPANTTGLGVLQNALTAKTDEYNRSSSMPDVMKAAGITGYGALTSQMQAKRKELDARMAGLKDKLLTQGTKETDVYNAALKNYEILSKEYNQESDRLTSVVQKIMDHEQALDLYEQEQKIKAQINAKFPSISNQIAALKEGFTILDGNKVVDPSTLHGAFALPSTGKYRETGLECGEAFNSFTAGPKVGDTFKSKIDVATNRGVPQVGNGLVLPLSSNGHVETVIGWDPATQIVSTVSYNRNGDGKETFESYNLADLQKLGNNWGFINSKLTPEYEKRLSEIQTGKSAKLQKYLDIARKAGIDTALARIDAETSGNETEKLKSQLYDEAEKSPGVIPKKSFANVPGVTGYTLDKIIPDSGLERSTINELEINKNIRYNVVNNKDMLTTILTDMGGSKALKDESSAKAAIKKILEDDIGHVVTVANVNDVYRALIKL